MPRSSHIADALPTGVTGEAATEWERWLAQFRPEARALMNLLIDINVRLAREALERHVDGQHMS